MKYTATILAATFSVVSADSPPPSFVEQFKDTGGYSTVVGLLNDPILQSQLAAYGPITVFGPDNAAFAAAGNVIDGLDRGSLLFFLSRHLVSGVHTVADVKAAGCVILTSLIGPPLRAMYVKAGDDDHDGRDHIMINDAMMILADIDDGTNIFHGLDKFLLVTETYRYKCPAKAPSTTNAPVDGSTDAPANNNAPDTAAPTVAPVNTDTNVAPSPTALSPSPMAAAPDGNETSEELDSGASFCGISAAVVVVVAISALISF